MLYEVITLPVGNLDQLPRIVSSEEQLQFESNFCEWSVMTKEFMLYSPSGENVV